MLGLPQPISTDTRTPDVNPCRHRHLDLIVASAPSRRLIFVVLPLYARHREGRSPERQEGQRSRISWRPVEILWKWKRRPGTWDWIRQNVIEKYEFLQRKRNGQEGRKITFLRPSWTNSRWRHRTIPGFYGTIFMVCTMKIFYISFHIFLLSTRWHKAKLHW